MKMALTATQLSVSRSGFNIYFCIISLYTRKYMRSLHKYTIQIQLPYTSACKIQIVITPTTFDIDKKIKF